MQYLWWQQEQLKGLFSKTRQLKKKLIKFLIFSYGECWACNYWPISYKLIQFTKWRLRLGGQLTRCQPVPRDGRESLSWQFGMRPSLSPSSVEQETQEPFSCGGRGWGGYWRWLSGSHERGLKFANSFSTPWKPAGGLLKKLPLVTALERPWARGQSWAQVIFISA